MPEAKLKRFYEKDQNNGRDEPEVWAAIWISNGSNLFINYIYSFK